MSLTSGSRLGPYEIVELRGKGGMGEVYRARDPRLERDVAIKVLPEHLSGDAEYRRRLEREAKTISQLQHPHVCTLFDIGSQDGHEYLVMELLEGETLEERLGKGALPLEEVLEIGGQVAEAIEAAHRHGVVHRDLKPGNVMLTASGAKVLDFGLAKGLPASPVMGDTQTPTATQMLTSEGSIVGTLHYMAPEQLEGKDADARSDLFALGVVLYEMASGKRPFQGETQASLIASIMTSTPMPLTERAPLTPARLGWVVERCLQKNPERRWQSARDVAIGLDGATAIAGVNGAAPSAGGASVAGLSGQRLAGAFVAALLLASVASFLGGRYLAPASTGEVPSVAAVDPAAKPWTTTTLALDPLPEWLSLSSDGRRLLFRSGTHRDGTSEIQLRELHSSVAVPLAGTDGAVGANFSLDGEEIFFGTPAQTVERLSLTAGSSPEELASGFYGWIAEDELLYYVTFDAPAGFGGIELWRRRVDQSEAQSLGAGAASPRGLLPDGRGLFLFRMQDNQQIVERLDLQSLERVAIGPGIFPSFLPPHYLVYTHQGTIWAMRLDSSSYLPVGEARAMESGVVSIIGLPVMALSRDGDLTYRARGEGALTRAHWVTREGLDTGPVSPDVGPYHYPRLSLDGRFLSVKSAGRGSPGEQRRLDLETGAWTRRVQPGQRNSTVQWFGRDRTEVIFNSDRETPGRTQLFIEPADGSAPAQRLLPSDTDQSWFDISLDGRTVIGHDFGVPGFWRLDRDSGERSALLEGRSSFSAAIHPSGRWLAYANQGYQEGIWIMPLDDSSSEQRATRLTEGVDLEVLWSPDGSELYYRGPTHVMSIPVSLDGERLVTGRPQELFEDIYEHGPFSGITNWAVHPDGRFVFFRAVAPSEDRVVYIENWGAKVAAAFDGDSSRE